MFVTISFHDVHLFDPSPECEVAYRSFLCLYLFGACDSNSSLLATQATCSHVRDGVCEREWREIDSFLRPRGLPVCEEELPEGHLTEYTGMLWPKVYFCMQSSMYSYSTPCHFPGAIATRK